MIYGGVKLLQISPAKEPAVSRRDKRRQIGCFPDRQGGNPASVCVNKNAAISPSLPTGLTPLSIRRAPVIAHGALPSPVCLSRPERREVVPPAADEVAHGGTGCPSLISSPHSHKHPLPTKKKKSRRVDNPLCLCCKHNSPQSQKSLQARLSGVFGMIQ